MPQDRILPGQEVSRRGNLAPPNVHLLGIGSKENTVPYVVKRTTRQLKVALI
jgi:hypothetical protein